MWVFEVKWKSPDRWHHYENNTKVASWGIFIEGVWTLCTQYEHSILCFFSKQLYSTLLATIWDLHITIGVYDIIGNIINSNWERYKTF